MFAKVLDTPLLILQILGILFIYTRVLLGKDGRSNIPKKSAKLLMLKFKAL